MNILIVDDEISAIEAVKNGIVWGDFDLSSVYTANSMKDAIEQFKQHEINIMLSDIEMPMGSGIDLLRWVKSNKPNVECIFMTCHADFEYAQATIQLGGLGYLLKPLNYEDVEKAIAKAIDKIVNETKLKQNSKAWIGNKETILKQFWKDFFLGDISPNKDSILRYVKNKNIEIDLDKNYLPILLSIKKISEEFASEKNRLIIFAVLNIVKEFFEQENTDCEIMEFNENSILIIFEEDKNTNDFSHNSKIKHFCLNLVNAIKSYLNTYACCYIGKFDSILAVPNQIEQLQVMDFQNISYHQMIIEFNSNKYWNFKYHNPNYNVWSELIQTDQLDKLSFEIKKMLTSESVLREMNRDYLKMFYQDFYYILITFSLKNKIFLSELFGDSISQAMIDNATISIDNTLKWVDYSINILKLYRDRNDEIANPVDKTKRFIEEHIAEEISMKSVAENVHLNSDYLTRIFKKEEGISINKYIINCKIDLAKKLLRDTDKPIGDIALEVGYYNYSSFNRIFSKIVEMSPYEFKCLYKDNAK